MERGLRVVGVAGRGGGVWSTHSLGGVLAAPGKAFPERRKGLESGGLGPLLAPCQWPWSTSRQLLTPGPSLPWTAGQDASPPPRPWWESGRHCGGQAAASVSLSGAPLKKCGTGSPTQAVHGEQGWTQHSGQVCEAGGR